ncbi:MAG: ABC transporter permease, partial [Armatimonadetes bacterium]|nr:ABC transporter permease [Armatimonadota bacterium]
LYVIFGVGGGILAAVYRGSWVDKAVQIVALGGLATPSFWLAIVFQVVFFAHLRWLPATGRLTAGAAAPPAVTGLYLADGLLAGNWPLFWDALRHILMPAAALLLGSIANVLRITRRAMLQVFGEPYVGTARAKGLGERRVILRHALKNAAIPVLTMIGLQTGFLFSSAVVIENVFSWPGLGKYAVDSIANLDFPPIMGVTLIVAALFVLINLVIDLLYPMLDPRIQY